MILVIGGAYAGKLTWAVRQFRLSDAELCDLRNGFVPGKRCYYHLEALPSAALPDFPADAILLGREIGCGIVPLSRQEREHRERYGSLLQALARNAEQVYRVFCGLAVALK